MAIPERMKLRIVSLEDSQRLRNDKELDGKRTLVIVSSIKDASRLYILGMEYTRLNIGNNKASESSTQLSYSVWVDKEDLDLIKTLMDRGVEVFLQSVPRERLIDMKSIIDMVNP
jgi:mannose/fructose/N-acetylgalactosamine-specific phosphotransferase system component IIB